MTTYIVRRLIQALFILIGLSVVFFLILHLTPGGPCAAFEGGTAAFAQRLTCEHRLGLDKPLPVQYFNQMGQYLHGDLGTSSQYGEPVTSLFMQKLPATVLLMGSSYLLQQLVALPLGMLGALKQYSFIDTALTFVSYMGLAMPTFWLGLMLLFFFTVQHPILPPGRIEDVSLPVFWSNDWFSMLKSDPGLVLGDLIRHLILPAITLMIVGIAADSRFMRSSMLEVMRQDYIRTAKAKGLARRTVIFKHAFRNALLPIITNIGLYLPALLGGAVITETIFSWTGIGFLYITAVNGSDYPLIQGISMILALAVLVANLLTDLTYAWVDPRIRFD